MASEIKYSSAISYGLWIPVSLVLVIAAVTTGIGGQLTPMIILGAAIFGIVMPIFFNTNYTIMGDTLKVRSGWMININVPIADIKTISKTSSILSAPALSVSQRIEITYGKFDSVVISPADRNAFVAELLQINPDIQLAEGI